MRSLALLCAVAIAGLLLTSCSQPTSITPTMPESGTALVALPVGTAFPNGEQIAAQFEVRVDPATLATTVEPIRNAQAQPPQGNTYDLDIQNFLKADSFRIVGASLTDDGDFRLDFTHAHPFAAPNFASPITGANRADLGYTGRLLVLVDGAPSTYFGGEVALLDDAVIGADGYLQVGDLLATTGLGLNTFPYVLLADDAQDNRVNRTNSGSMTGNYDPFAGGWQRANAGGAGEAWVGYDFLHGGQIIANSFTLSADALAGAGFRFTVGILIKYTDPRGAGGKDLRFPPETPDVLQFAYRLPYAALDVSQIALTEPVEVDDLPAGDTATLSVRIRDWDAQAPEGADATVGDDPDITRIQAGAAGAPTVSLDCPALFPAALALTVAPGGSGEPFDEKIASGIVTNQLGTALAGTVLACLKVVDPEDADSLASTYRYGVDPTTILPDPARALAVRTYQIVPINVRSTAIPPVVTGVTPTGIAGESGAMVEFVPTVANTPTGWSWNFGTGAAPITSTEESPTVTLGAPGIYSASLVASNGAGASPVYQFSYTVEPVSPPFASHSITSGGGAGSSADMILFNNKPVICFYTSGSPALNIAIAKVEVPVGVIDWDVYAIDQAGNVGKDGSLAINNGRLAISYYDEELGDLKVAQATVDAPAAAGDWAVHVVDALLDSGDEGALLSVNGKLAVAYHSAAGGSLKFAQASIAVPASSSDWNITVIDNMNDAGGDKSMVEFHDRLVIAYEVISVDDLKCAISNSLTPASEADWTTHLVDGDGVVGEGPSLAVHDDLLSLTYDYDTGDNLRFARARVEFPASAADWNIHDPDTLGNTGERTSLLYYNNRAAVTYFDNSNADLRFARAKVAEPGGETDWQLRTINAGNVGRENTSLIVLNDGTFAIAYQADGNLAFARAAFPW